jgi:DNA-binding MarR family transcriptional regulator
MRDATAPRPGPAETEPAESGPADSGAPERFVDGYLLYLLARASSIASAEFHTRVKERGVAIPVWRILAVLKGTAGVTVGELAARCLANQPTITKTVDRMQAQGLVVRMTDAGDRRRVFVRLTPAGESLVDELIGDARRHQAMLEQAMGVAESRVLVDALQRLIASTGSDC